MMASTESRIFSNPATAWSLHLVVSHYTSARLAHRSHVAVASQRLANDRRVKLLDKCYNISVSRAAQERVKVLAGDYHFVSHRAGHIAFARRARIVNVHDVENNLDIAAADYLY